MDEMRGRTEFGCQIGVLLYFIESFGGTVITEPANHAVDGGILAKLLHPGSEHYQVRAIGQRHAGAVNCLVPQPGAVKLLRVQVDDGFSYGPIEERDVGLNAQLGCQLEALDIVADEQAADHQLAGLIGADHRLHIDDGDVAEEPVGSALQPPPHRVVRSSHDLLHAHHRPKVVAAMNAERTAGSYQDVLVVVGHPDYFVGHHLADRKHQVEASLRDHAIHLRRPGVVKQTA